MASYLIRRLLLMVITLWIIATIAFIVVDLPPGDFMTNYIIRLERESGTVFDESYIESLKVRFGLNRPWHVRYLKWVTGLLRGDLGYSFMYERNVNELFRERIGPTLLVSISALILTYALAIPISIYSAMRQRSFGDYLFSGISFVGMATPNFLLALLLMYWLYKTFGVSIGGLFSREMIHAPWSLARFVDMLNHLWVVIAVVGTAGTAGMVRRLRGLIIDELEKDYVRMARAKGNKEIVVVLRHVLRIAINPILSTIGWTLAGIFGGDAIVSIVIGLPTMGPLLLDGVINQDMHLAGSYIVIMSGLTILGTFISDVLIAVADPRIKVS